jgi:hypothetical protein
MVVIVQSVSVKVILLKKISCDIMRTCKDLEGYSYHKNKSCFNKPVRRNNRNELYRVLCMDLKRVGSGCLTEYDRYYVLQLLIKKVKEGGF